MADLAHHIEKVKKYTSSPNEAAVAAIVKHLGIALQSRDGSFVSAGDASEMKRVRESWMKKKLGLTGSDEELDKALQMVAEKMKADRMKERVTLYYLIADHFGKLGALTQPKPAAAKKGAAPNATKTV
jgi:hypothetical protein